MRSRARSSPPCSGRRWCSASSASPAPPTSPCPPSAATPRRPWRPHAPALKDPHEAALAQPVEHRIRNARVACSSHAGGTISSVRSTRYADAHPQFSCGAFSRYQIATTKVDLEARRRLGRPEPIAGTWWLEGCGEGRIDDEQDGKIKAPPSPGVHVVDGIEDFGRPP
jgi:hypothetical protein